MEIGQTDANAIPAWFTIEKGRVKETDPPRGEGGEPAPEAVEPPFDEVRSLALASLTKESLRLRQALVPDYQLQNAGLGIYDDGRVAAIRATVNAFRDEVKRLEAAIGKARSARD